MRLHRLSLAAFGPFADEIDIDLDALGADGLFLLHGDTGAGKTTLLDAIAFALFGRVPGARNEAKRLRCDRAAADRRTFVRLEATLGGHRLEIVRSPAYLRPKARGTGLTEEKAKVSLRWLDAPPGGVPVDGLTRAEEVGQTVIDLLGMSADQFFQVVLLPQGEFAKFLRSDTAEREVLLERLFDTGRFGTVEDWFAGARRDSASALKERLVTVGQLLARVAEAAGRSSADEDDTQAWIADLRDRLADQVATADQRAVTALATTAAAEQVLGLSTERSARLDRLRGLRRRQQELLDGAAVRADWQLTLSAHAGAQPVIAAAGVARLRAARSRDQQRVVDRMRSAAERLVAPDEDVPKVAGDLRIMSAVCREKAGSLAGLIVQSRDQDRDQTALSAATGTVRQLTRKIGLLEQSVAQLPIRIGELTIEVDLAESAARALEQSTQLAGAAAAILLGAESVVRLTAAEQQARAVAAAAVDEHQRRVDRRQQLVQARISGMAAELAVTLVPGQGCPVCGSAEHPEPAMAAVDAVTVAQITAAERAEKAAFAARHQAASNREALSLELAQARAAAGERTVAQAREDLATAEAVVRKQTAAAAGLAPARQALTAATGSLEAATKELQTLLRHRSAAVAEVELLTLAIADRESRLAQGRAGYPDVAGRRDHLVELADSLDRLAAASEKLDALELEHAEAATAMSDALARSPFTDVAAASAAASIDAAAVAGRLRAAEDELTVVAARLQDPELAGLDEHEDVDLPGARARAEAARTASERAVRDASALTGRRDQVAVAVGKLLAAQRELEPVVAADRQLAALTDVILGKGQNARTMSLRTYVLAAKLGQVAIAAGQRLATMSGGRYTFVQSQEKESRGRSGGLGLDISDAFSGLVRPAKTLSGGESFLASLALALGLADVVAAEAGGRQLDTMFIDEGFGSLDADTLDMVMGTLDELRAGGRIVGLVSHVDELRQRIPSRLRIRRTPAGSELEMSSS